MLKTNEFCEDRRRIEVINNTIKIYEMRHPAAVSDFIRCVRNVVQKGYKDIYIEWEGTSVFPNACVPICGMIQYYKEINNIEFQFKIPNLDYLETCGFEKPFIFLDDEIFGDKNPFDKIYRYSNSAQVASLTQGYINSISKTTECGVGIINGLIWCLNEVMDNVLVHSEESLGFVMAQFHPKTKHIAICIYDYGVGIYKTLKRTPHKPQTSLDAISLSLQEGVGDGKGQGNGLFGLFGIVKDNGGRLTITSGDASIMYDSSGEIKKFKGLPYLSYKNPGTVIDFQLDLTKNIDMKTIFQSIGGFDGFDIRIDDMIQENDILLYDVYENCSGTATRMAGEEIRNDVINIIKRTNSPITLDFTSIQTVSSSFIDEFIAKMVVEFGFVKFSQIVRFKGMNENVEYLCNRSIYMRIFDEWKERTNSGGNL